MADQEVVKLLEEIRDLQKVQTENWKASLANQELVMKTQKNTIRRSKVNLVAMYVFLGLFLAILIWSTFAR